jgi:HEPN domain-containing protein
LLGEAEDLINRGKYGIAIVVAHIACEVAVQRALSAAFAKRVNR